MSWPMIITIKIELDERSDVAPSKIERYGDPGLNPSQPPGYNLLHSIAHCLHVKYHNTKTEKLESGK